MICHDDLFWTNVIFRDGQPVALIDWDLAKPAPRLADVARASSYWAPLVRDAVAEEWGLPTDRRGERLRLLCDAYGLEAVRAGRLLDRWSADAGSGTKRTGSGAASRAPRLREMWDARSVEPGSRRTCAGSTRYRQARAMLA